MGLDARVHRRGGQRHVAEQGDQAEHQRVGGQDDHVALDHVAAIGGEHPGGRVRVDEQRQRGPERERGVGPLSGRRRDQRAERLAGLRVDSPQVRRRGLEDVPPAAQPGRDVEDRDDDRQVDQRVLDERDQGWGAQPGQVGALDARERTQGPDHPDTLAARGDLASGYHSAGRFALAIPLYEQTLREHERVLGPDHPHTLTSRANLASAYHGMRRRTEAVAAFEAALADCEQYLPPRHPMTQTIREHLEAAR
jgi:hypothetical protein